MLTKIGCPRNRILYYDQKLTLENQMNDESKSVNCEQTEELKDYHTWSKNNLDLPLCVKEEAVFSPSLVIKNTLTGESWPFYDNYTIQDSIAIFFKYIQTVESSKLTVNKILIYNSFCNIVKVVNGAWLSYDSSDGKYKIPNFEDVEVCKARKDEYERLNPGFTLKCLGPTWSKSESDTDFIPKVNQQLLQEIKNDGKYGFGSTVSGTANLFGIWDSPFKLDLENDHSLRYFTLATAKSGDIQWNCRLNSECSKIMPELAFHGLKAMFSSAARNDFSFFESHFHVNNKSKINEKSNK